jgi:hypothetical protein
MGRSAEPAPTVIFPHLGKTGGATLRRIIPRNFLRSEVLALRNPASSPTGFLSTLPIERFAEMTESERRQPRFIMAHMMFGLHEFVPRPSTYITLLRNPVSRVISGYKNALHTPGHRFHETVVSEGMDLEGYLRSGLAIEMDNSQMRAIVADTTTPYGACTNEMLERAKRTVDERISVAGIAERFDESLVMLRHVLGWSKLHYVVANVSPHRIPRSAVPAATIRLIEDQNRFDIELYKYAVGRLDKQIADDPDFDRDLARFRRGNACYRPWGVLSYSVPARLRAKLSRTTT